ncbi:MAG: hypothetical protein IH991_14290 [Planctomycetes bacterium]|nr:hypothetical protein [Planctomycetota bacterium]
MDSMNALSNQQSDFHPARTLEEVAAQAVLEPLEPGDQRYADLSAGRDTRDLLKLKQHIKNCRQQGRFAVCTLTGHRGCGKSTELQRLIKESITTGRAGSLRKAPKRGR